MPFRSDFAFGVETVNLTACCSAKNVQWKRWDELGRSPLPADTDMQCIKGTELKYKIRFRFGEAEGWIFDVSGTTPEIHERGEWGKGWRLLTPPT